ncbi:uncharacterized protein LOC135111027 isoform X2 [Scylla paramamosain]|uniref:uncharacterized protein LOC135111027 isoform X2 n=1 Tax=Scylla paramamosain TaxID=85552 RepID=UPI0030836C51
MKLARGFCDLNISATDTDLKKTLLKALSLGYQTLAVNREVTDTFAPHQKGKKRKKDDFPVVLPPPKVSLTKEELDRHGISREPVILTRITITYADPGSAFLSKFRNNIKQYDIVAFTPTTDSALKQTVSQTLVDVDIIALGPEERGTRFARKLLRLAVERNIYFELSYGPCITNSTRRQQTITLAHILHHSFRAREGLSKDYLCGVQQTPNNLALKKLPMPEVQDCPYLHFLEDRTWDLLAVSCKGLEIQGISNIAYRSHPLFAQQNLSLGASAVDFRMNFINSQAANQFYQAFPSWS